MTAQRKLIWFGYDLEGSNRKIGIYEDGRAVTPSNVALLDEHDSAIVLGVQKRFSNGADGDYFAAMQSVLRTFYASRVGRAVPSSAGL